MNQLKWYGILFSLFILFLYVMGIYDLPMMLSHNTQYYISRNYGEGATLYFTNYPFYMMIFWITNLICGLLSPVLFLIKNKYAYKVAFVSAFSDFVLMMSGIIFRNRINALGTNIFYFDLFILIITFLFGIYLYILSKKSVIL